MIDEESLLSEKNIFNRIIGQEDVKMQLKGALLSKHHILVFGPPGVGKTTLAKNIAEILPELELSDCPYRCEGNCPICRVEKHKKKKIKGKDRFIRIQGSPDLTVEDVIGDIDPIKAMKFGPLSLEAFTPGKIFRANRGILFFDEINRAPEKLQNALLQVLQEGNITLSSYLVSLPVNFIFIGTLNPKDITTERLSNVLMDRFDVIYMGYPETLKVEREIVLSEGKSTAKFDRKLIDFCIEFIRMLREDKSLDKVPSVRASISLYERAQSNALINGRKDVNIEDISAVILSVLLHRIGLKPSKKVSTSPEEFILKKFSAYAETVDKGGSL